MPPIVPPSRPRAKEGQILLRAQAAFIKAGHDFLPEVFLVGVRSYYRDTMGKPGTNDRGIYDDALFIFGPDTFAAFNGNTDPTAWRPKVATLLPGVHWYKPGKHGISRPSGGYPAFRPATKDEALPVARDGVAVPWPGIAINIHRGGVNTTSSEGCQTIPPAQWEAFHALLTSLLKRTGQKTFPYILLEGPV